MGVGRYGRTIAICSAGQLDVGQELVRSGLALAYRRYSKRYITDEDFARKYNLGMWRGKFQNP